MKRTHLSGSHATQSACGLWGFLSPEFVLYRPTCPGCRAIELEVQIRHLTNYLAEGFPDEGRAAQLASYRYELESIYAAAPKFKLFAALLDRHQQVA